MAFWRKRKPEQPATIQPAEAAAVLVQALEPAPAPAEAPAPAAEGQSEGDARRSRSRGSRGGQGRTRSSRSESGRREPTPGESRTELRVEDFDKPRSSRRSSSSTRETAPTRSQSGRGSRSTAEAPDYRDSTAEFPATDENDDAQRGRTRRGSRGGRGRSRGRRDGAPIAADARDEESPVLTVEDFAPLSGTATLDDAPADAPEADGAALAATLASLIESPPSTPAKPQPPRFEFGRRTPVEPEPEAETAAAVEDAQPDVPEGVVEALSDLAPEAAEAVASAEAASAVEAPEEKPKRSTRGTRGGRGRSRSADTEAVASEDGSVPDAAEPAPAAEVALLAPEATETVEVPPARTSRGRRASERQPQPAVVAGSLEELVARQTAAIEALQRQLGQTMDSIDRSLLQLRDSQRRTEVRTERLGVFVDVANVELEARKNEVDLDWGNVVRFLSEGRRLVSAVAYAPITDDKGVSIEANPFVHPFLGHGFRIVSKEIKRLPGGEIKANFDVELAIDVLSMADRLDVVVLITGDGDFTYLVERLQARGLRVEVSAFPRNTSRNLRLAADEFYDIRHCARGTK